MRIGKTIFKIFVVIVAIILLFVGSYVAYVTLQYYRIEDNKMLDINNKNAVVQNVKIGQEYKISTYNIGFGAYNHDFAFFMDNGEMQDGTKKHGKNSRAKSRDVVITNTNGAINAISSQNVDFAFFQEVDFDATRSHHINQVETIGNSFLGHVNIYAQNFHTAYLLYPIHEFHGKVNSGLVTLSNKVVNKSIRRSFPVDNGFPTKFFDLDRCFDISYLPIENNDKFLCLVNVHTSAFDKGGLIRQQQMKMLNDVLKEERSKGNYIVAGGDFNHDIANSCDLYPTQMKKPEWVYQLDNSNLTEGFRFVAATNVPTCRSTDMPYTKGVNYTVVLDGFIVSDNVSEINITNIDLDFEFSDHNPAVMTFKLN